MNSQHRKRSHSAATVANAAYPSSSSSTAAAAAAGAHNHPNNTYTHPYHHHHSASNSTVSLPTGTAVRRAGSHTSASSVIINNNNNTHSPSSSTSANHVANKSSSNFLTSAKYGAGGNTAPGGHAYGAGQRDTSTSVVAAVDDATRQQMWGALCARVLPLFSGQGLKGQMEDLNDIVSAWLSHSTPTTFDLDLTDLFTQGLSTLPAKLATVTDDAFITRVVEVWTFYLGNVVPYVQGVFLPVRTVWAARSVRAAPPDVRTYALVGFRDQICVPIAGRLMESFTRLLTDIEAGRKVSETASRLMQMLCLMDSLPHTPASSASSSHLPASSEHPTTTALLARFKQCLTGSAAATATAGNRNSMAFFVYGGEKGRAGAAGTVEG